MHPTDIRRPSCDGGRIALGMGDCQARLTARSGYSYRTAPQRCSRSHYNAHEIVRGGDAKHRGIN